LGGGAWFSVIDTREYSDWSKQAISTWNAEFTVWREGGTLRVGLVQEGVTHLVRELFFDRPVAVGPNSCSPKGPRFPMSVTTAMDTDGGWHMVARAGQAVPTAIE
jgi:regulation of enolase protein 1 (concanavalin A-like superfamily)